MNNLRQIFGLLFLCFAVQSCADEPTCLNSYTSLIKIKFVDEDGAAQPIIIKSLTALEANMDIYPEYTNDTTSSVNINLNPNEAITTLVFEQESSVDTLILTYALIPEFISSDCGLFIQFNDLDTISTTFDTLKIIQPIIDDEVDTNIEIIN
jgi:hypothetical protein